MVSFPNIENHRSDLKNLNDDGGRNMGLYDDILYPQPAPSLLSKVGFGGIAGITAIILIAIAIARWNTSRQKKIIMIAIVAICFMGIFPPWIAYVGGLRTARSLGYSFILNPPTFGSYGSQISFGQLFLGWVIVAIVASGAIYLLKDKG